MGIHWYIFSAVIVIVLQRYLFRYFGMRKVELLAIVQRATCFEGDDIEMIERLANGKLLPVPWLRVESVLHAGLHFQSDANFAVSNGAVHAKSQELVQLEGNKQLTRRHAVQAAQRGCYRITSASLTFGDLFGLFSTWRSVPLQVELLVYPLPADRDLIQLPSRSWQGRHRRAEMDRGGSVRHQRRTRVPARRSAQNDQLERHGPHGRAAGSPPRLHRRFSLDRPA